MKVGLGMTKEQVTRSLGEPKMFRGSIANRDGQIVEIYEYDVDTGKSSSQVWSEVGYGFLAAFTGVFIIAKGQDSHIKPFWFYFHDNMLVKWGGAGDWKEETRLIHEMKFI